MGVKSLGHFQLCVQGHSQNSYHFFLRMLLQAWLPELGEGDCDHNSDCGGKLVCRPDRGVAAAGESAQLTRLRFDRITSYNVCYTKLLRMSMMSRAVWIDRSGSCRSENAP